MASKVKLQENKWLSNSAYIQVKNFKNLFFGKKKTLTSYISFISVCIQHIINYK